jgi:sugar phosphate isomerase/epimerase
MAKLPIALQLYTVRDDAGKDFAGTIKKVAEIGYSGVELAGHGGLSVQALKTLLDDNGLRIAGSHIGIDALEKEISKVIDENLALGNPNIVVPYLSEDRRADSAGYKKVAEALNGFGETLHAHGLNLAYHNHAFEFETLDNGQNGMQILLDETDPALVKAEIDTYWVLVGGHDPVAFVKKYAGRVILMHIKDRNPEDGSFAEVGTGDLPLDGLVDVAPSVGASWLIVEQDVCKRPPLEAVTISYNNLKAKGYV